ncbi:uncharacterized protein G2W53_030232 [Senna tora]|uniref:Uncharacterized protein n=1 Tax=Senna tora TaxID=362788 RepID=A0A834T560_9FABA|nr:uncharacterized protein G2W53_030232 [Senna tora]
MSFFIEIYDSAGTTTEAFLRIISHLSTLGRGLLLVFSREGDSDYPVCLDAQVKGERWLLL